MFDEEEYLVSFIYKYTFYTYIQNNMHVLDMLFTVQIKHDIVTLSQKIAKIHYLYAGLIPMITSISTIAIKIDDV